MPADQSNVDRAAESKPFSRWLRPAVQMGFVASTLLVGWQFHRFVVSLAEAAAAAPAPRPASVEAWLPISSLMSLTYLARTGRASPVHPAGLVIFSLTLIMAVAMRRGFCSWVCPVGTLSEYAHKAGRKLLGRNLPMPRWLDLILRALRYVLLGFFLYSILMMPVAALGAFIQGPYNRIADVKMYLMFADISSTTLWVLAVLLVLSVLFKNFWCRYLCPYGALLGLLSVASPMSIRRDPNRCIGCGRCGEACPNRIPVHRKRRVWSVECTACFTCVAGCPKPGALRMALPRLRSRVTLPVYGAILVALFVLVPQLARSAGYWQTDTPPWLYARLYAAVGRIEHPNTSMMRRTARRRRPPNSGEHVNRNDDNATDRPPERRPHVP